MKVAIFGPFHHHPSPGGVEQHVFYLADSLEKLGVEIERWSWKIEKNCGNIKKLELPYFGSALNTDADIIHMHTSVGVVFSYFSGLDKFKGKKITTIHAFHKPELESSVLMKIFGYTLSKPYIYALKKIENNIAVSRYTKEESEKRGVPIKAVIGNGIKLSEFKNVCVNEELECDVILVARLTKQKGIYEFIKAFSGSPYKAMIVGHGEPMIEKKIWKICKDKNIKLILRPKREILLSAIKSSKVLAMPSVHETFGIVGLEAMALGKPVVVYDVAGGPLDYVKSGHNGLVVSGKPTALRIGVKRILEDNELLKKMSKNALKTAKKYEWSIVAEKIKKMYESVLDDGPELYYRNRKKQKKSK